MASARWKHVYTPIRRISNCGLHLPTRPHVTTHSAWNRRATRPICMGAMSGRLYRADATTRLCNGCIQAWKRSCSGFGYGVRQAHPRRPRTIAVAVIYSRTPALVSLRFTRPPGS